MFSCYTTNFFQIEKFTIRHETEIVLCYIRMSDIIKYHGVQFMYCEKNHKLQYISELMINIVFILLFQRKIVHYYTFYNSHLCNIHLFIESDMSLYKLIKELRNFGKIRLEGYAIVKTYDIMNMIQQVIK